MKVNNGPELMELANEVIYVYNFGTGPTLHELETKLITGGRYYVGDYVGDYHRHYEVGY